MDHTVYIRDHTMHGARRWRVMLLIRDGKNNIIAICLIAETQGNVSSPVSKHVLMCKHRERTAAT
jgi:hypothetical protein